MNSGNGWGDRGDIKPSARRSIHSHYCCPFAENQAAMVRYGITEKKDQQNKTLSPSTSDSGHDEVDNVMSKHVKYTNAVPINPIKIQRRNSYSFKEQDDSEEDSTILSKSLPEKIPLHLYCSDESYTEENDTQTSNHSQYQSFGSNKSLNQSSENRLLHENYGHKTESYQPQTSDFQKPISLYKNTRIKNETYIKVWLVLLVAICAIVYALSDSLNISQHKKINSSGDTYDEVKFYDDMSAIGKYYNVNQNSILQLQVGITSISEREDTDSFIFVYDSDKGNFNSTVFNEFINEIASVSARYLRNESASVSHIVVDTSSIIAKNSDELIHKYSDDITKGGVMVMTAIDMLPSSLAMALHYYCDEFNPLVKKSAMFFTLDISNCSDKVTKHLYIEKCLKRKWSSVSSEFISPLLTRVVSVVVDVTSSF